MKNIIGFLFTLISAGVAAQFDPLQTSLVYHHPDMDRVTVKSSVYREVSKDTALSMDVYYPPNYKGELLPVVIFNNGVGSSELPQWKIYRDWASVMAANGMIAINHQARNRQALEDFNALLEHLTKDGAKLGIQKDKIGVWVCSANTQVGWPVANDTGNTSISAIAVYYGFIPATSRILRRSDLEILLVRAGLDSYGLNKSYDELVKSALEKDAHLELINYPEGQHAFDAFDNTPRSREIILQTVDFFKRSLRDDHPDKNKGLVTNQRFWHLVLDEEKTDEALAAHRRAFAVYSTTQGHTPTYNQLINENNLAGLGYELLKRKRFDEALKIFKLNGEHFPGSANPPDCVADVFDALGEADSVLKYAGIALSKLERSMVSPNTANAIRASAEFKIGRYKSPPNATPGPRAHHGIVYHETLGKTFLFGGSTAINNGQSAAFYNDAWSYDGAWTFNGNISSLRSGVSLAYDTRRNRIYSFGGFSNNVSLNDLREFDGVKWATIDEHSVLSSAEGGLVYDIQNDRLLAFGGSVGRGQVNADLWEWKNNLWNKIEVTGPEGRSAAAMIYDSKRKKVVLYGGTGANGRPLDDLWEFDGTKWAKITAQGPGPRFAMGAAYDSKRGTMIIYGGLNGEGIAGDTWSWDGKAWKKLDEEGPGKRIMGYLSYDRKRDRLVLFGGRLGWPNDSGETWEWDGKQWNLITIK